MKLDELNKQFEDEGGFMGHAIDRLPVFFLLLTFMLMPFLAIAGGLGFAPAGGLIGLSGWILLRRLGQTKRLLTAPWVWALCALLLWCSAAQLWSPYTANVPPGNGVKLLIIGLLYCGIVTSFKVLQPETRKMLCHLFLAGAVFGAGLMLVEILSNYGLTTFFDPINAGQSKHQRLGDAEQNLGRGILAYMQFLPGIALMFAAKFKHGYLVAGCVSVVLVATSILNALIIPVIVFFTTFIVMVMAWKFPKSTIKTLCFGIIILIFIGPLSGFFTSQLSDEHLLSVPVSLEHRFRMWAYTWERVVQNPWLGNGFDVSRTYQDTFTTRDGWDIVIVSLHPHNVPMQIWLELGAIGVVLAAGVVAALIKPAIEFAQQTPLRASALAGTITAVTLFGAVTIGAWQFWWIGSIFIAIGALQLLPKYKNGYNCEL